MRSATRNFRLRLMLAGAPLLLLAPAKVAVAAGDSWLNPPPAPMPTARRLLAAASLRGKVYTFGGCGSPCFQPPLHTSIVEETKVEVYNPQDDPKVNLQANPQSEPWITKRPMPTILYGAAAIAIESSGLIYTVGGYLSGNVLQEYNPVSDSWRLLRPMPTARYGAAAVALGGKIYVVGGSGPSAALEVYDPATDTWSRKAPMPTARVFLAAAVLDGKIYAIGGSPDCCGGAVTKAVEIYDPATDSWQRGSPLPVAEQVSAAAELNGRIYVFGGFVPGSGVRAEIYQFDPASQLDPASQWTTGSPMPTARDQAPAVAVGGQAFVLGGSTDCHCRAVGHNDDYRSRPPDLVISVNDGVTRASSCAPTQYTITVTNRGTDPVAGAAVSAKFTAPLLGVTWTCRAAAGAHCTRAGPAVGDPVADQVDLPGGGSVTYTVTATLSAAARGVLVNEATVTAPDGTGARDSDSDAIDPPNADLEVRVPNPPASVRVGETLNYLAKVINHGPCPAYGVILTDSTPGVVSLSAQPKFACKTGSTCHLGSLLPTESTSVAVTGPVSCNHPLGSPVGTVSVFHDPPTGDIPEANNHASIPTRVDPAARDLAIQISAPETVTAGETVTYGLTVNNRGPSPAQGVVLTDSTPGIVTAVDPPGACQRDPENVLHCALGPLAPAAPVVVTVSRQVDCGHSAGSLGGVVSAHGDPATCDQSNPSASVPTQVVVRADYAIRKIGPFSVVVGSGLGYTITVTNPGPSCPSGVLVSDLFPQELLEPHWCRGERCTPQQPGDLVDRVGLPPHGTESYRVTAAVSSLCTTSFPNTATVKAPDGVDPNSENDVSTVETQCLPAPLPCVDCPVPILSGTGLLVFALLLALVPLARLRRRTSL
jgi:uncharacterized repeat protein (TIGR01451 family)